MFEFIEKIRERRLENEILRRKCDGLKSSHDIAWRWQCAYKEAIYVLCQKGVISDEAYKEFFVEAQRYYSDHQENEEEP